MLYKYHVIYSVRYYPRFHVTAVGLRTYYPRIRGHYCNLCEILGSDGSDCKNYCLLGCDAVLSDSYQPSTFTVE
jgi:hypothetical protein